MKKNILQVGKWYFKLGIIPDYQRTRGYVTSFGIFKLKNRPLEGEIIQPKHYTGFWWRKEFDWQGFEVNF